MFCCLPFYYRLLFGLTDVMACCVKTRKQFCNKYLNILDSFKEICHTP
jgi:hypothetical protein